MSQEPKAPAPVAVVRDFVNSTDHETGTDELATRAALVRYLVRHRLLENDGARATSADLALAHRLRGALRSALEANHGLDHQTDRNSKARSLPELATALGELPVALTWTEDGPVLCATAGGVRGGLARIGLAAHEAATQGLWWRLKICSDDECQWAYYDQSRNRSRSWCEYGCGNKAKTRAYRARQRAAAR